MPTLRNPPLLTLLLPTKLILLLYFFSLSFFLSSLVFFFFFRIPSLSNPLTLTLLQIYLPYLAHLVKRKRIERAENSATPAIFEPELVSFPLPLDVFPSSCLHQTLSPVHQQSYQSSGRLLKRPPRLCQRSGINSLHSHLHPFGSHE